MGDDNRRVERAEVEHGDRVGVELTLGLKDEREALERRLRRHQVLGGGGQHHPLRTREPEQHRLDAVLRASREHAEEVDPEDASELRSTRCDLERVDEFERDRDALHEVQQHAQPRRFV